VATLRILKKSYVCKQKCTTMASGRTVGKFKISRFDPDTAFQKPFNMVLLGKKATGKSTLMKDIMYHLYKQGYPRVVVFSGTEQTNHFFSDHVPSVYIHNDLDLEVLSNVIDTQKQVVAAVKSTELKLDKPCGVDTRILIVLDDVVYQRGILANNIFRFIFFQGRHNNISLLLASQYLMYVPVEQRANIDFLVCMKENIPKNRYKLYESFFGCFEDRATFSYVLDQLTQNYEVCILDNTGTDLSPEHCVRWYKAELNVPQFKFNKLLCSR